MNKETPKKNVMFFMCDHWPGRLMGCKGHKDIFTPTLDTFCKIGVNFENCYSTTPVCIPARRELMTGMCSKSHGDRGYTELNPMPDVTTLAQAFRNNGYQAFGVGKLHVYPVRSRIGFDDVILNEEARRVNFPNEMREDDYIRDMGEAGQAYIHNAHGVSVANYFGREWHLDEKYHQTNWTMRNMCKQILRRDPTKPAFWYCGFTAPHPPLVPPRAFLQMYDDVEPDPAFCGDWAKDFDNLPYCVKYYQNIWSSHVDDEKYMRMARKYFYATCTQVDYAIRTVIGTLREEKLLDNTIIVFASDHGELLGNNRLFQKNLFYEDSTKIPLIIVPTEDDERFGHGENDYRLVELRDVMPTLLDMCGLEIPETVDGMSLVDKNNKRDCVYGELWEDVRATRMIRTDKYKLIYYSVGNKFQLFDMENDPNELVDLSDNTEYANVLKELTDILISRLYGGDLKWLKDGKLVGEPDIKWENKGIYEDTGIVQLRSLCIQRGIW